MLAEPLSWALHAADLSRRLAGHGLDLLGLAPAQTPSRIALNRPGFRLRAYTPETIGIGEAPAAPPAILIVPAPIKRSYIWDLTPNRSVVRAALSRGWRVYLLDWQRPDLSHSDWGLSEYANSFPAQAVEAVQQETNQQQVVVFSHSLGGTLAAIYAALHPEAVSAMVLLETPLYFGRRDDAFAPLVAAMPTSSLGRRLGTVPGTVLNTVSGAAAPEIFQWFRQADLFASLADHDALMTHHRVERWSLDEFPMPGKLFDEIIERLYRADEFMSGGLLIDGRVARPEDITAPVLSVFNPHSRLITADMIRRFHAVLPNPRSTMMHCFGEVGSALEHVAPLVGRRAHRGLWPRILKWMERMRDDEAGKMPASLTLPPGPRQVRRCPALPLLAKGGEFRTARRKATR